MPKTLRVVGGEDTNILERCVGRLSTHGWHTWGEASQQGKVPKHVPVFVGVRNESRTPKPLKSTSQTHCEAAPGRRNARSSVVTMCRTSASGFRLVARCGHAYSTGRRKRSMPSTHMQCESGYALPPAPTTSAEQLGHTLGAVDGQK